MLACGAVLWLREEGLRVSEYVSTRKKYISNNIIMKVEVVASEMCYSKDYWIYFIELHV